MIGLHGRGRFPDSVCLGRRLGPPPLHLIIRVSLGFPPLPVPLALVGFASGTRIVCAENLALILFPVMNNASLPVRKDFDPAIAAPSGVTFDISRVPAPIVRHVAVAKAHLVAGGALGLLQRPSHAGGAFRMSGLLLRYPGTCAARCSSHAA